MILSRPMIYDSPFSSECEKFIVRNDRLHWGLDEQLWFFLNVMILSRPMIYDSPFSSEYEKYREVLNVWW